MDITKLEKQADLLFQNVAGWETFTLERMGKRIGKIGKMSLSDVKTLNNIADVKGDIKAIQKELARITGLNVSQISKIYGDVLADYHLQNKPLYDYRNKPFVPFKDNKELQAIVKAYSKTTAETMVNLSKTKALAMIGNDGEVSGLQKAYTDVIDQATMQVATGAEDFNSAMRGAIRNLGGSGIRIDYGGGITRRLDTVVRQNLLWGAKQASIEYAQMIGEELGCDGIEVDWHSNPRPGHRFMQGKQFCNGKSRTINDVFFQGADEVDPKSEYGQTANQCLQEYGCLHFATPIICGVSEPTYSETELARLKQEETRTYTVGNKTMDGYGWTQAMRKIETEIRKQKGIKVIAKASGDKKTVKDANERLKALNSKYNEITEATGFPKETDRTRITK